MNVVLLRVGIDTGSGGILGPLFANKSFEFIPIPDECCIDARTYGNYRGRHGRLLYEYFPEGKRERMRQQPMHVDPEFKTFTYGDPTNSPKRGLRKLMCGDLLVFYAGLKGYDCNTPPALYIVGYFEVEVAGRARELIEDLGEESVVSLFAANFHVMHCEIFAAQQDHLVLVKGSSASRLLRRPVKISEDGEDKIGRHIYRLSGEMQERFGVFGGHLAITRSTPRWVEPPYIARAADFVRSLDGMKENEAAGALVRRERA